LSDMLCEFNGIKSATITTPMMIASYVKHTFHANGEISSVAFPKFDSSSRSISQSSIYRSLGSAGATGYAGYRSAWDDEEYRTYNTATRPTIPSVTSTPSTPTTASAGDVSSEALDEYRKQQMKKHRSNGQKPWKHSK
jgi:hypothetical protein